MAWTTPRTWVASETVTAALMNTHIKDNLDFLKTSFDNDGRPKTLIGSFAGAGNNGTTVETDLCTLGTIPANTLTTGNGIWIRAWGTLAQNTNTKTIRFYVGASFLALVVSNSSVANNRFTLDFVLVKSAGTNNNLIWGVTTKDVASGGAVTPVHAVGNLAGAITWSNANALKITGQSSTASNDISLINAWVAYLI